MLHRRASSLAAFALFALVSVACTTNKYAGAGANAATSAVIYAATGCKYAGCPTGRTCDQQKGTCEPLPCGEQGCSVSEECDAIRHACVPRGSLAPMPITVVPQTPPPSPTSPTTSPGGP